MTLSNNFFSTTKAKLEQVKTLTLIAYIFFCKGVIFMKLGIVGSRSFPQLELVKWFIEELPEGVSVISGGG